MKEGTENLTEILGREKAGHAIAGVGQNLIFGLWSGYTLVFFTDVMGISGAVAGLIMMFTRFFDAVYNPIMGTLADRTRTRWGRYRPWLMFMAMPVCIMMFLSFRNPGFDANGQIVYAAITYVLMSMVFTCVDVPYWTMPAAMAVTIKDRTSIFSLSRTSTTLTGIMTGIIVIPLVTMLGTANGKVDFSRGFMMTALIISVCGAALYLVGFSLVREHVTPPPKEKHTFAETSQVIFKNKPLILIIISQILATSCMAIRSNLLVYWVQYNVGSIALVPLFSALMLPGILAGMLLTPILTKKLGQKGLYIFAFILGGALNVAFYFVGYTNLPLVIIFSVLTTIPFGFLMVLCSTLVASTIEYAEWKTGLRCEGLISSTQTLTAQICIAIGGLSGLILTIANYIPNAVQAKSTLDLLQLGNTVLPAAGLFLGIIPMLFYDLTEKRHAEIVEELQRRKLNIQAGEIRDTK
jgi:sugar (glycoside-pentoside-hexuronide) transporter